MGTTEIPTPTPSSPHPLTWMTSQGSALLRLWVIAIASTGLLLVLVDGGCWRGQLEHPSRVDLRRLGGQVGGGGVGEREGGPGHPLRTMLREAGRVWPLRHFQGGRGRGLQKLLVTLVAVAVVTILGQGSKELSVLVRAGMVGTGEGEVALGGEGGQLDIELMAFVHTDCLLPVHPTPAAQQPSCCTP